MSASVSQCPGIPIRGQEICDNQSQLSGVTWTIVLGLPGKIALDKMGAARFVCPDCIGNKMDHILYQGVPLSSNMVGRAWICFFCRRTDDPSLLLPCHHLLDSEEGLEKIGCLIFSSSAHLFFHFQPGFNLI